MEIDRPKTTFDHAREFYERKVAELQEKASKVPEGEVGSAITIFEQIEESQLKLKQVTRRHDLGLLK